MSDTRTSCTTPIDCALSNSSLLDGSNDLALAQCRTDHSSVQPVLCKAADTAAAVVVGAGGRRATFACPPGLRPLTASPLAGAKSSDRPARTWSLSVNSPAQRRLRGLITSPRSTVQDKMPRLLINASTGTTRIDAPPATIPAIKMPTVSSDGKATKVSSATASSALPLLLSPSSALAPMPMPGTCRPVFIRVIRSQKAGYYGGCTSGRGLTSLAAKPQPRPLTPHTPDTSDDCFGQRRIPVPPPAVAPTGASKLRSVNASTLVSLRAPLEASVPPSLRNPVLPARESEDNCATCAMPLTSSTSTASSLSSTRQTLLSLAPPGVRPPPVAPKAQKGSDRKHAQIVRGLLKWVRADRRNELLKLASKREGHPCHLAPCATSASLLSHALSTDHEALSGTAAGAPCDLSCTGLKPKPPAGAMIAGAGGRASLLRTDPNLRQAESSLDEEHFDTALWCQDIVQYYCSTQQPSRSSVLSVCSTAGSSDSGGLLCSAEASPRWPSATPRCSHAPDRSLACPSASLPQAEATGGSDIWDRSSTLLMCSSWYTNTSLLTMSFALAFGSFSTSSESSLTL
ncbi:hypothetical protein JIQ42_02111 [Leishmania sp. Namibia]|uniref:hypothetical protein n=1 Tax=Leishmania sp. Namibia TaxID=2802991 RepID=UPI001B55F947|nr:hypothetical protein JIQ42_02111 [Leishmania sp. Namibia]